MTRNANPLPETLDTGWPRRQSMPHWTPAEEAIYDAVHHVERLGADPLLTDAIVLLSDARTKVADWLGGKTRE